MSKNRYDISDQDLLNDFNNNNMSLRQIGKKYNLEHHSVKQRLIKLGIIFQLKQSKDTSKFQFDLERALELHKLNYSCNKIGNELGCEGKVVKKHLEKAGIVFDKAFNSHKKLDNQIERIKELYDRGFSFAEIGRMLNTSGSTIKSYLKKYAII